MKIDDSILLHSGQFYIDGKWVAPHGRSAVDVVNPTNEETLATVPLGDDADVDRAIAAARQAFTNYGCTSIDARIGWLRQILAGLLSRKVTLAKTLSLEMGQPYSQTSTARINMVERHFEEMLAYLGTASLESRSRGGSRVLREPIGVCALITPWNGPITQIVTKLVPALAAGCTMVLKPSEIAPLNAILLAEIIDETELPPGVFNLVNGSGTGVGARLSSHPDVDMVSFTGSTRAGIQIAVAAAPTVKRVHQELGGKSANILLDDVDLLTAVRSGVLSCYANSGQSCVAPSRMFVPEHLYEEAVHIARTTADALVVGVPFDPRTDLGPVASSQHFAAVQGMIEAGISEGARLVTGGMGRPNDLNCGYFVRPTVFADITSEMMVYKKEIFGPVVGIRPYSSVDQAIELANESEYGLAGFVQSGSTDAALEVAKRLRAGYIYVNNAPPDYSAPFGGYKRSGNGREYGEWGLEAFQELKTIAGCG